MKRSRKFLSLLVALMMVFSVSISKTSAASTNRKGNGAAQSTKQKAVGSDRASEDNSLPSQTSDSKNPFGAIKSKGEATPTGVSQATPQGLLQAQTITSPITLSDNRVSLSAVREIDIAVNLGYAPDLNNIEWTIGGKSFDQWKKYYINPVSKTGSYTGVPFITFSNAPTLDGNTIKATIKFGLPYDTVDLSGTARRLYPSLMGNFDLVVKDTSSNTSLSATLKFNAYDSYHTYNEIKPDIDRITASAKSDRYIEYKSLGKTVQGRDAHFAILAKNEEAVDQYINEIEPMMVENPKALQNKLNSGKMGDYKIPIWFNNIHPDEAPGIDAIIQLFDKFATQDTITYNTTEVGEVPQTPTSDGNHVEDVSKTSEVTIDVTNALDNFIFLFNFTENPDGRANNLRANANGFDINRDNVYQTQVEAQMTTSEMMKWKPLTFLDFHGFVKGFLLEPCTTPHDPNFEYDLLIDNMVKQAHQMGNAGVANTKYTSYVIPYEDYAGGWDDAVPSYTAVFAMSIGALGHTVEIPDLNEDSVDALVATGLANVSFVSQNKNKLFNNQLEYYKRGVEGIDAKEKVDPWMLNAEGQEIGRPRGDHQNFFPEYYVIPVDKSVQKNSLEAYKMVQYLLRNDIKVGVLKKAVNIDQKIYSEGSYIIDMHQALRGYANEVLFDGYDVSGFAEMYAEIINAFPDTRGFDRYTVWQSRAFSGKVDNVQSVVIPKTIVLGNSKNYIIGNTNNDAVKAVNELLKSGNKIEMLKESGKDYNKGDYLVSKIDLEKIKNKYFLDIAAYSGNSATITLVLPKVAAPSATGHLTFALKELGFDVGSNADYGNVIVTDSSTTTVKSFILSGKSYIGIGGSAMSFLKNNIFTKDFSYISSGYEGLMRGNVAQDSMITSGYAPNEIIYDAKGAYISSIPDGAKVLTSISGGDDYFKAGWWPNSSVSNGVDYGKLLAKGKPLAIASKVGNSNITVFANNLVNKGHPQKDWRMLANAIFNSLAESK
jgi:hypothetical protein